MYINIHIHLYIFTHIYIYQYIIPVQCPSNPDAFSCEWQNPEHENHDIYLEGIKICTYNPEICAIEKCNNYVNCSTDCKDGSTCCDDVTPVCDNAGDGDSGKCTKTNSDFCDCTADGCTEELVDWCKSVRIKCKARVFPDDVWV